MQTIYGPDDCLFIACATSARVIIMYHRRPHAKQLQENACSIHHIIHIHMHTYRVNLLHMHTCFCYARPTLVLLPCSPFVFANQASYCKTSKKLHTSSMRLRILHAPDWLLLACALHANYAADCLLLLRVLHTYNNTTNTHCTARPEPFHAKQPVCLCRSTKNNMMMKLLLVCLWLVVAVFADSLVHYSAPSEAAASARVLLLIYRVSQNVNGFLQWFFGEKKSTRHSKFDDFCTSLVRTKLAQNFRWCSHRFPWELFCISILINIRDLVSRQTTTNFWYQEGGLQQSKRI